MHYSLSCCSCSLLDAIMGWIRGSLPGSEDWASWLLAPSGGKEVDMSVLNTSTAKLGVSLL